MHPPVPHHRGALPRTSRHFPPLRAFHLRAARVGGPCGTAEGFALHIVGAGSKPARPSSLEHSVPHPRRGGPTPVGRGVPFGYRLRRMSSSARCFPPYLVYALP